MIKKETKQIMYSWSPLIEFSRRVQDHKIEK